MRSRPQLHPPGSPGRRFATPGLLTTYLEAVRSWRLMTASPVFTDAAR